MQKSYMINKNTLQKRWYLFDAENQILGRLAVQIATILMGKHRPWYTPSVDTGDFVVVVNIEKIKTTGKKLEKNMYYFWSEPIYPGGLKTKKMKELSSEKLLRLAVKRMLPKTQLARRMLRKLKIYTGPNHPHTAQCPQAWKLTDKVTLKEVLHYE